MINVEAARKFVAALRSGDYDQTRGRLISYPGDERHPKGKGVCYCAEGVYALTALDASFENDKAVYALSGTSYCEAGFLSDEALISVFGEWVPVRVWNDSGLYFSEIADRLEAVFPEIKI